MAEIYITVYVNEHFDKIEVNHWEPNSGLGIKSCVVS